VYQKDQPFHSIIVETIDTIRYSFVVNMLARNLKPVLITGPSGTGKSIQLRRIDHAPLILTSTTSHFMIQMSIESKL
jgi:transcriptional regulator with AAA-type ATPase domain